MNSRMINARALLAAGALFSVYVGVAQADSGPDHQTLQPRPIALGTSGGSIDDLDGGFCCGGTLGGLLQDASGELFILSNNHVLGRTNRAVAGEETLQPGLIDSRCQGDPDNAVADFEELIPIDFDNPNRVDAAIARVRPGTVSQDGVVLDISTPSSEITPAVLGMEVQKSGRTSGHTVGQIVSIDVVATVAYPKKCGSRGGQGALMIDQLRISDGSFSTSGDSGSVIFETGPNPRAVGLLFAGSSTTTLANRIENVLDAPWGVGPLAMAGGSVSQCTSDGDCDDGDGCTDDLCLSSGACSHSPIVCDDGDACTADSCSGGTCTFSTISCNDGDACTADSCDSATGCANDPIPECTGPCGDGVCDIAAGEDCSSCPEDCAGVTRGRPTLRFCCGSDTFCDDSRCLVGGDPGTCSEGIAQPGRGNTAPGLSHARAAKQRHSERLLSIPDVVGHGIGFSEDGQPLIEVYLGRNNALSRARIPAAIEGVPVRVEVTGSFVAY